jgi:7-cyano-7-deazaguanine synthase
MSENKKKAVVLISGGMDSAVTAAIAARNEYQIVALHFNYGQRTQQRELQSFNALCNYFKVSKKLIVDLKYLSQIGGSSLTDTAIEVSTANLNSREVPQSYVPFRNANFLSIAVSWAEVIQARAIFIGAVEEDSSGYPDCRSDFFDAFQEVVNSGTKSITKIRIITPILHCTKEEIVQLGARFKVPFQHTWSCYKESEKACGVCDSCALRLRGFQQAGIDDPLPYIIKPQYI